MPDSDTGLIVFDIDGTLLQTDLVTVPAVRQTFAQYGLPVPGEEAIRHFFGKPVADYEAWLAGQCPQGRAEEIVAATNARELECIAETGRLYPGVMEVLDTLRIRGLRIALCSNGPDAYVNTFADAYAIRPYCDAVLARDTHWPDKTVMLGHILELVGARPVIVAGDRHDDIEAAHEHGGLAIGAAYGFGSPMELEDADVVVRAASDIPEAVTRLLAGE